MELQHIIWSWDMITRELSKSDPDIGRALVRSCRPIAAQRYRDGRLLVVIGCWWLEDKEYLEREASRARLKDVMGSMLGDRVATTAVRWPGGVLEAVPAGTEEEIPPPDILQGLPDEAREEAAQCESAIQRLFFARAYARGLRLQCQYSTLTFRLDFAIPERRMGAEAMGWDWRMGPSGAAERRERQEQLEQHGWRIVMFSGSQVLADVDRCVSLFESGPRRAPGPGQPPSPTRPTPGPRTPRRLPGIYRPPRPDERRPGR